MSSHKQSKHEFSEAEENPQHRAQSRKSDKRPSAPRSSSNPMPTLVSGFFGFQKSAHRDRSDKNSYPGTSKTKGKSRDKGKGRDDGTSESSRHDHHSSKSTSSSRRSSTKSKGGTSARSRHTDTLHDVEEVRLDDEEDPPVVEYRPVYRRSSSAEPSFVRPPTSPPLPVHEQPREYHHKTAAERESTMDTDHGRRQRRRRSHHHRTTPSDRETRTDYRQLSGLSTDRSLPMRSRHASRREEDREREEGPPYPPQVYATPLPDMAYQQDTETPVRGPLQPIISAVPTAEPPMETIPSRERHKPRTSREPIAPTQQATAVQYPANTDDYLAAGPSSHSRRPALETVSFDPNQYTTRSYIHEEEREVKAQARLAAAAAFSDLWAVERTPAMEDNVQRALTAYMDGSAHGPWIDGAECFIDVLQMWWTGDKQTTFTAYTELFTPTSQHSLSFVEESFRQSLKEGGGDVLSTLRVSNQPMSSVQPLQSPVSRSDGIPRFHSRRSYYDHGGYNQNRPRR